METAVTEKIGNLQRFKVRFTVVIVHIFIFTVWQ